MQYYSYNGCQLCFLYKVLTFLYIFSNFYRNFFTSHQWFTLLMFSYQPIELCLFLSNPLLLFSMIALVNAFIRFYNILVFYKLKIKFELATLIHTLLTLIGRKTVLFNIWTFIGALILYNKCTKANSIIHFQATESAC